ncbi:protease SohB [Marinimicrobium alkaliphilum]|uniref:protease SohB n=1 Tax=Marinimicrobium alkaliphilum TaxID=2202654 RepID=UPI000DB9F735|nr:protease SohB [Marinimicrobium alkaliphilum]
MEFISEYGLFLAKTATFLVAVFVVVSLMVSLGQRGKKGERGHIEVTKLNDRYEHMSDTLKHATLDDEARKLADKARKKHEKKEAAERKKKAKEAAREMAKEDAEAPPKPGRKRVFVLNFEGDIKASATDQLREEVTAVLTLATSDDEVVVRLESGGGMVHSYGLASSQLARIADRKVPLTACVDKVAASGGYMMACVADKVLAAPFAVMGSIGVVAQLPNFHRLLKKNDIDFELFTAGEYKRTVTMFGENTRKAREKFTQDLEDTHVLFKEFVREHRPSVDIDKVATGEVWYGRRAQDVNLVDGLQTSDEYLLNQSKDADIYEIEYVVKKSLPEKLGVAAQAAADRLLLTWWARLNNSRWF